MKKLQCINLSKFLNLIYKYKQNHSLTDEI
jgi:hypothetical protein